MRLINIITALWKNSYTLRAKLLETDFDFYSVTPMWYL